MALKPICKIDDCHKPVRARGMCAGHWQKWRATARPDEVAAYVKGARQCKVEGCLKSAHRNDGGAHGWCKAHYARWIRHGDASAGRTPVGAPLAWIEAHARHDVDECLRWPFSMSETGPSTVSFRGRSATAARVMCTLAHGDPPTEGHEAAHSCGKAHEGCINPRHLRWATCAENHQDAISHGTHFGLQNIGSKHPMAKLNEESAARVKIMISHGYRDDEIGELFGVSRSAIFAIRRGRTWRHVEV